MEHIMNTITGSTLAAIAEHLEAIAASLAGIAAAVTCAVDAAAVEVEPVPVDPVTVEDAPPAEDAPPTYEPLPLDQVAEQVEALEPLGWVVGWDEDGVPIADDTDNLVILEDGSVAFPHWCGFLGWDGPVNTASGADWSEVTDYWTMEEIDVCF